MMPLKKSNLQSAKRPLLPSQLPLPVMAGAAQSKPLTLNPRLAGPERHHVQRHAAVGYDSDGTRVHSVGTGESLLPRCRKAARPLLREITKSSVGPQDRARPRVDLRLP